MSRRELCFRACLIGAWLIAAAGSLGWLLIEPSPLAYSLPDRVGVFVIVASAIAFVLWPLVGVLAIVFEPKRWLWVLPGWFLVANPCVLAGWLYLIRN